MTNRALNLLLVLSLFSVQAFAQGLECNRYVKKPFRDTLTCHIQDTERMQNDGPPRIRWVLDSYLKSLHELRDALDKKAINERQARSLFLESNERQQALLERQLQSLENESRSTPPIVIERGDTSRRYPSRTVCEKDVLGKVTCLSD